MKRASVVLVCIALWTMTASAQEVTLEKKYAVGEVLRYKTTVQQEMTSEEMPGGNTSQSILYSTDRTDSTFADGSAVIIRSIDSVSTLVNGKPFKNPQMGLMVGLSMRIRMNKHGKPLDVQPTFEPADDDHKKQFGMLKKQAMKEPGLPEKPVKFREPWTAELKDSQELPMGTLNLTTKMTMMLMGFDKQMGKSVAVIRVNAEISGEIGVGAGTITGSGRGNAFIGEKDGRDIKTTLDLEQALDVNTPQGSAKLTIRISQKKELLP